MPRLALLVPLLSCLLAASPPETPKPAGETKRESPMPAITIELKCAELIKLSAEPSLLDPPQFALVLTNRGKEPVEIDEVQRFDYDTPSRVRHTSASNAAFTLVRVGEPKGNQSYTCAEMSAPEPVKKNLAPGESYSHPVMLSLDELKPGEYEATVEYRPLQLKSPPRRFKVVR